MFLRLNLSSGGTREIKIETTDWECHEDTAFDAAVTPFALDRWIYDHAAYPIEKCLTPELIESECIGIGTQLFFVGLFKKHSPESKNIPILRVGNIAAMPDVTVKTEMGLSSVYLVESRSIGGLSGSPVFTYKEPWVVNLGGETEIG